MNLVLQICSLEKNEMDLNGKSVVVFGGLGEIGIEICNIILERKISKLAIADIRDDAEGKARQLIDRYPEAKICVLQVDMSDKTAVDNCYKEILKILVSFDVVLNTFGIINDRDPHATIAVNLIGVINSTLSAISHMDKSKGGKGGTILNVSSVLGLEPAAMISVYSASKHGVVGFTRSLANDFYFAINGVKLILVCPGLIKTALTKDFVGRDTFPYSALMSGKLQHAKRESAKECAEHTVHALEVGTNGSVWITDLGELKEIQLAKYWQLS